MAHVEYGKWCTKVATAICTRISFSKEGMVTLIQPQQTPWFLLALKHQNLPILPVHPRTGTSNCDRSKLLRESRPLEGTIARAHVAAIATSCQFQNHTDLVGLMAERLPVEHRRILLSRLRTTVSKRLLIVSALAPGYFLVLNVPVHPL